MNPDYTLIHEKVLIAMNLTRPEGYTCKISHHFGEDADSRQFIVFTYDDRWVIVLEKGPMAVGATAKLYWEKVIRSFPHSKWIDCWLPE
jgi:hypothetical protein